MGQPSAFGGASGEVVRGFVRPATMLSCGPVVATTLVLGVLAGLSLERVGSNFGAMAMGPATLTGGILWLGLLLVGGVAAPTP
jgi:hypothetical protein